MSTCAFTLFSFVSTCFPIICKSSRDDTLIVLLELLALGGLMTNIRSLSINSSWDLLTLIMLLKFCWHLADQMPFFVHLVNRLLYYLSVLYRWKSLQWECIRTSLSNNLLWFENQQQKASEATLFENYSKCRIWILAFFINFCPIKNDLSGNTVWPKASGFQKIAKMDHFWHF